MAKAADLILMAVVLGAGCRTASPRAGAPSPQHCAGAPLDSSTTDASSEYTVYRRLLIQLSHGASIVLLTDQAPRYPYLGPYEGLMSRDSGLVAAFVRANSTPIQLSADSLCIGKPIVLVPSSIRGRQECETLHARYHASTPIFSFSRVGFSANGRRALLEVEAWVCWGGSSGYWFLAPDSTGAWTTVEYSPWLSS